MPTIAKTAKKVAPKVTTKPTRNGPIKTAIKAMHEDLKAWAVCAKKLAFAHYGTHELIGQLRSLKAAAEAVLAKMERTERLEWELEFVACHVASAHKCKAYISQRKTISFKLADGKQAKYAISLWSLLSLTPEEAQAKVTAHTDAVNEAQKETRARQKGKAEEVEQAQEEVVLGTSVIAVAPAKPTVVELKVVIEALTVKDQKALFDWLLVKLNKAK